MRDDLNKFAAKLLNEYFDAALAGAYLDPGPYLERCPTPVRDDLRQAIGGIDTFIEHYHRARVEGATLQAAIARIQLLREQEQRLLLARSRARDPSALSSAHRHEYLVKVLALSPSILQRGAKAATPRSSAAMIPRGRGSGGTVSSWRLQEAHRRAVETLFAAEAQELLDRLGLSQAPVDLDALAERLYLFVQEIELEDLDGCLVTDGVFGGILLNKSTGDLGRKRFTLAHEIAHFLRHRHLYRCFDDAIDEIGAGLRDECEFEANVYAGMLLLPASLVPTDLARVRPQLQHADALMESFKVSLAAAMHRLIRMSDWRCAFVVSKDHVVERWVVSPLLEGVVRKPRVHPHSIAGLLSSTDRHDEDATTLPAHAWFEGSVAEDENTRVREESRRLRNGYVYTVLTVLED